MDDITAEKAKFIERIKLLEDQVSARNTNLQDLQKDLSAKTKALDQLKIEFETFKSQQTTNTQQIRDQYEKTIKDLTLARDQLEVRLQQEQAKFASQSKSRSAEFDSVTKQLQEATTKQDQLEVKLTSVS